MKTKSFIAVLLIAFSACTTPPQKIAEWRGPNRSGNYPDKNLLKSWPQDGPTVQWESDSIGFGYSSPIVTDNAVYVDGMIDSLGYLFKFDLQGNEKWRMNYGQEWTKNFVGTRGTPTLIGDQIFLCSGLGELVCVNTESGQKIWSKNMETDFGGVSPRFGFSQAIAVDQENVYCIPGGSKDNVVALNKNTGETVWSNACFGERPAYNSPLLIDQNGHKILVAFSAYHLLGLDAKTGELLWSDEQTNTKPEDRKPGMGDTHGNTVLFDNGSIYYAAGDGNGGVKLQLNEDGTAIEKKWDTPSFDVILGGIVKDGDKLYGSSHRKQQLLAINCETGAKTDSLELGRGSVIAADGDLYFFSEKGMMYLVNETPQLTVSSSFKVDKGDKEYYAHPVIHNGVLYIRHGNYLGAYQVRQS